MKTTWRRIFYVVMIVNFLVGITLTIINTVTTKYFPTFLSGFMETVLTTAFFSLIIEHFRNVEKGIDSANRRASGQPQLPDSAYSSTPNFIRKFFASQAGTSQPSYNQSAPRPAQPAQPVQPVQPAQPAQPVQPAAPAADAWTCSCGTVNAGAAKFCKSCGKPKQ